MLRVSCCIRASSSPPQVGQRQLGAGAPAPSLSEGHWKQDRGASQQDAVEGTMRGDSAHLSCDGLCPAAHSDLVRVSSPKENQGLTLRSTSAEVVGLGVQ